MEKHFGQIERLHMLAEATLLDLWVKKPAFVNECYVEEAVSTVVGAMTQAVTPATATEEDIPTRSQSKYLRCGLILSKGSHACDQGLKTPTLRQCWKLKGFWQSNLYPVQLTL